MIARLVYGVTAWIAIGFVFWLALRELTAIWRGK